MLFEVTAQAPATAPAGWPLRLSDLPAAVPLCRQRRLHSGLCRRPHDTISFVTRIQLFPYSCQERRSRFLFVASATDSTPPAPVSANSSGKNIVLDEGFSPYKISFGVIGLAIGGTLLSYGFGAYFTILPGSEWSALMLTYGFPLAIIGMALKMASGSGDGSAQPLRRSFTHMFRSRKSRASAGPTTTPPAATSTPPAATTPPATPDPLATTAHTPPVATTSTHPYHSPDPQISPGYPYTPYPPSTYPYPPYAYYPPPPHYSTYPPAHAFHSPVPPPPATQPDAAPPAASSQDTRQYIEPEGDTFNPHKQATHKIRDLIRGNFEDPYL